MRKKVFSGITLLGLFSCPLWSQESTLRNESLRPLYYYLRPKKQTVETAEPLDREPIKKPVEIRPLLEIKAGYFIFSDSKMREVYDQGGLDVQLSVTYPIWEWLQLYASLEMIHKKGRSTKIHRRTHFYEYPASLGLRAVAAMSRKAEWYLTLGPRYIYVHVHNNSPYVDRNVNHSGVGGFANTGFNFFPSKHFLIDIFGEYSYARMHFRAHKKHVKGEDRQVGGFVLGGGIGYSF